MIDSWGCELEFGDVDRNLTLPKELGSWNYFETDIVNQREPFWGIASDPNGIDPPFGGEINTRPTKTWLEQINIFENLKDYFSSNGCYPTVSCVSNTHIHVKITEVFLDRLLDYTERNQKFFIDLVYDTPILNEIRTNFDAIEYLNYDSGKLIEPQKFDLFRTYGNRFGILNVGNRVDGILRSRYAINLQSIKYNGTIEFRCFRATLDKEELANCFRICELFILCAIKGGPDLETISSIRNLKFPKLNYDHELFELWQKTKKPRVDEFKTHIVTEI